MKRFFALLLFSFLVYAPVLGASFLADDFGLVRGVRDGGPFGVWMFGASFFRPLAAASAWLDWQIWGLYAPGFHVTNVLLHAAGAFALFELGRRLGLSALCAAVAAALFAVTPSHAEPVTWISCRGDLIATGAGLFACCFWIDGKLRPAIVLLVVALLAKEAAAPLCLALAAWEWRAPRRALPALGIFALYLVTRRLILGEWIGGYGTAVHLNWSLGEIPANLGRDTLRALAGVIPAGGWASLPIAAAWFPRRTRWLAVAYVLTLLPVLNLGISPVTTSGERLLYLPSALLWLLAVMAFSRVIDARPRTATACVAALAALLIVRLEAALVPFREASRLVVQLLPEIEAAQPLTLVNLPDNLRGAYVFRNGLDSALALHGHQPVPVIVRHSIGSRDDTVTVEVDDHGIRLQLFGGRVFQFSPPPGMQGDAPAGAESVTLTGTPPPNLWSYSAGHIHRVH